MASDEIVRARSFWSGTITFGLVSIPVNLFSGIRSQSVALHMFTEDGTPLSRRFFCPKQEREVDSDEIVRGYEYAKDKYVVVTDDELEALAPKKSRDIDLRRFVPANDIEPIYFERSYFLAPAGESTKAYRLLAASLEENKRAGIATFVMRGKEYLIAITAENGIMRADTMRFADELRSAADVGLPKTTPKVKPAEVKKMQALIKSHSSAKISLTELEDEYSADIQKLVKKKERKKEDIFQMSEDAENDQEDADADVIDLVEVLRRSLNSGAKKSARKTTKKTAKKRKKAS
ncbi:MAG TPA: Ku protein [Longimicrobiales bacterium]|nr:Ku protein [Longimicrobiales bacterium]